MTDKGFHRKKKKSQTWLLITVVPVMSSAEDGPKTGRKGSWARGAGQGIITLWWGPSTPPVW